MKFSYSAKSFSSSNDFSNPLAMSYYSYIQPFGTIKIQNGQYKRLRHKNSYQDIYNEKKHIVNFGINLSQSTKFSRSLDSLKKRSTFASDQSLDNTKSNTLNKVNRGINVNENNLSQSVTQKRPPASFFHELSMQNMIKTQRNCNSLRKKVAPLAQSTENILCGSASSIDFKISNKNKSRIKSKLPNSLNGSVKSNKAQTKNEKKLYYSELPLVYLSPRKITNLNMISNSSHYESNIEKETTTVNAISKNNLQSTYERYSNSKDANDDNYKQLNDKEKEKKKLMQKAKLKLNHKVKIQKMSTIQMTDVYQEEKRQRLEYEANKRKIDEGTLKNNIIQQERKRLNMLQTSFQSRSNSSTLNRNKSNSMSKSKNKSNSKSKIKSKQKAHKHIMDKSNQQQSSTQQKQTNLHKHQKGKNSNIVINKTSYCKKTIKPNPSICILTDKLKKQNERPKNVIIKDNNCNQIEEETGHFFSNYQPQSFRKNLSDYNTNNTNQHNIKQNTGLTSMIMESTNFNTKDYYNTVKKNNNEDDEEIKHNSLQLKAQHNFKSLFQNKAQSHLIYNSNNNDEIANISAIKTNNKNSPISKTNVCQNKLLNSKTSFNISSCEEDNDNSNNNKRQLSPITNNKSKRENEQKQISDVKSKLFEKKIMDWFEHLPNDNNNNHSNDNTSFNKQNSVKLKSEDFALKANLIKDKLRNHIIKTNAINAYANKEKAIESKIDQLPLFFNKNTKFLNQSIGQHFEDDSFYNINQDQDEDNNKKSNMLLMIPSHYTEKAYRINKKTLMLSTTIKGIYTKPMFKKTECLFNNKPFSLRLNLSTKDTDSIMPSNPFDSVVKAREFFFFE